MGGHQSRQRTLRDDCVVIAASCAAFTGCYFLIRRHVFPSFSADFSNRMTSLVHAVVMLPVSAAAVSYESGWRDFGTRTTDTQAFCLSITFGYFIYDTIGVYLIEHDWTNTLHHVASLAAFAVGIFQRVSGSELAWALLLVELTNPLLHLRSYFKVTGRSETRAAQATNVLFALSFLICRVLVGPVLCFKVLSTPTSSPVVKAGGAGVLLISFYWASQIFRVAIAGLRQPPKKPIGPP